MKSSRLSWRWLIIGSLFTIAPAMLVNTQPVAGWGCTDGSSGQTFVTVSIEVAPKGTGVVKMDDRRFPYEPMYRTVKENSVILLEADPMNGYDFVGWSGDLTSSERELSITAESDINVIANFSPTEHTLTIGINGSGRTTPSPGDYKYEYGVMAEVTAIPDKGWQFDGWSGDASDVSTSTLSMTIDSDKQITADFSQIMHELVINSSGNGSTIPAAGTYNYPEGTEVEITATPDSGWKLNSWGGDALSSELTFIAVTMDSDKTVSADFVQNRLNAGIIGMIAGTTGTGLAMFFITRRRSISRKPHQKNNGQRK